MHHNAPAVLLLSCALSAQVGSFSTSDDGCPATSAGRGDDVVLGPFDLGFDFPLVGTPASTRQVDISTNGYVYLVAGTIPGSRCCVGDPQPFLTEGPSVAALGDDLRIVEHGDVLFETDGTGVATITFVDVPHYFDAGANTFQVQLWRDGRVVLCYGSNVSPAPGTTLVGIAPTANAGDPGSLDLSAGVASPGVGAATYQLFDPAVSPFDLAGTSLEFVPDGSAYRVTPFGQFRPFTRPVELRATGTPAVGESIVIGASPLASNAQRGVLLIGNLTMSTPLVGIGAPGCSLLVDDIFAALPMNVAANAATSNLRLPSAAGAIGNTYELQASVISPGANLLGVVFSDRGTLTIGGPRTPGGPDCANATAIGEGQFSASIASNSPLRSYASCGFVGANAWYAYTPRCDGVATVTLCPNSGGSATFDSVLAAFVGDCNSPLQIACNDDSCGLRSEIRFGATLGRTYFIEVAGFGNARGDYTLSVTCN